MKIYFDQNFFEKAKFDNNALKRYFNSASKDLEIAVENKNEDVIFKFSYDALIIIGITLIVWHGFRVKSKRGHHIKIIEKIAQILENKDVEAVGEAMRKKRNFDLYEGGTIISEKEAKEYLAFIKQVIVSAEKFLKSQKSLF